MGPTGAYGPSFTFAFQPIADIHACEVFSYEALMRGLRNEPAYQILEQVSREELFLFDQKARVEAIELATSLGSSCLLNLNLLPQSLHSGPASIVTTMEAAQRVHL